MAVCIYFFLQFVVYIFHLYNIVINYFEYSRDSQQLFTLLSVNFVCKQYNIVVNTVIVGKRIRNMTQVAVA